jgi:hypothetical protein
MTHPSAKCVDCGVTREEKKLYGSLSQPDRCADCLEKHLAEVQQEQAEPADNCFFQVQLQNKVIWVKADSGAIIEAAFPDCSYVMLAPSKINYVYPEIEEAIDAEILFENYYSCSDCDKEWIDTWFCACDDKCDGCNAAISPHHSEMLISYSDEKLTNQKD